MKLWINVTTTYFWRGPAVGIIRTEMEIVKRIILSNRYDFGLVIFKDDQFRQVEISEYLSRINISKTKKTSTLQENTNKNSYEIFPLISSKESVKYIAHGTYCLMPSYFRPLFGKILKKIKKPCVKFIDYLNQKRMRKYFNHETVNKTIDDGYYFFNEGDIFFSIGLDWEQFLYSHFYDLKKKYKMKLITCCYDLIPVIYPQYCLGRLSGLMQSYFLELADASECILCISKCSQRDLLNRLDLMGGNIPRTEVFRLGCDIKDDIKETAKNSLGLIAEDFILFVSTIERRKNHEVLYKAYHKILFNNPGAKLPKLVFVGMQGWGVSDLLSDISFDPATKDHIIIAGRVDDEYLNWLYKNCKFVCFPSYYEGWGLSVGEALNYGKVVLASDSGAIPEIAGDLVEYADPMNPNEWAEKIMELCSDVNILKEKEERIKKEYKHDTWDQSANTVCDVIDSVIKK